MSRIEEALEKAAKMRGTEGKAVKGPGAPLAFPQAPLHVYQHPLPNERLKVKNPLLVSITAPQTSVAEEYRKLKSLLVKITTADRFRNTLMVTSALAGEGKSITAINLAVSLAQEFDHTVLLVDADLRKPSIHKYFGFEPKLGLADCLARGADVGDALVKTGIGKLSILPYGKKSESPGELFSSSKMKNLMAEIKGRYPDRYVIVDTPPVLLFAETRTISTLMDGVVFVVKERAADLKDVNNALAALEKNSLLGIVYNEAVNESHNGHYHDYYQHKQYAW
ncbi:XrtA-associated tyrosine autokinase [Geotalea sp. SG265]|uniref:XrtA-associated tyrosine autokinase n=1 Tax=Geotalea sp. SG265 TaxID=2922867 RepID=UPI001FAE9504|nr:XrtA-associated tyrosine autokinase [Geotalea sp. SG265]